jgi:hypothetical protein
LFLCVLFDNTAKPSITMVKHSGESFLAKISIMVRRLS